MRYCQDQPLRLIGLHPEVFSMAVLLGIAASLPRALEPSRLIEAACFAVASIKFVMLTPRLHGIELNHCSPTSHLILLSGLLVADL